MLVRIAENRDMDESSFNINALRLEKHYHSRALKSPQSTCGAQPRPEPILLVTAALDTNPQTRSFGCMHYSTRHKSLRRAFRALVRIPLSNEGGRKATTP